MNKYAVILLLLSLLVLSGCKLPPDNVPEEDMVAYRIVITSVDYSSNEFTVHYVFSREDAESLDDGLSANYEDTESFHVVDWIISPDPEIFSADESNYNSSAFSFTLNEGETVPETIVFNTTKPIYIQEEVIYDEHGLFGESKAYVTVAKAYFETEEIPVTIKDL